MDDPGHGVNPVSYEDIEHPPDGDLGPMVNGQPNPFHNNPDYEGGSRSGAHGSRRFRRDRSHSKRKDDDDDEDCGLFGCDDSDSPDADSPGLSGSLGKTIDKRSKRSPARSTPTPHPAHEVNPAAVNGKAKAKAKRDRMCSAGGCVDSIEPSNGDPLKPTQPDNGAVPIPSTVASKSLHYRNVSTHQPETTSSTAYMPQSTIIEISAGTESEMDPDDCESTGSEGCPIEISISTGSGMSSDDNQTTDSDSYHFKTRNVENVPGDEATGTHTEGNQIEATTKAHDNNKKRSEDEQEDSYEASTKSTNSPERQEDPFYWNAETIEESKQESEAPAVGELKKRGIVEDDGESTDGYGSLGCHRKRDDTGVEDGQMYPTSTIVPEKRGRVEPEDDEPAKWTEANGYSNLGC